MSALSSAAFSRLVTALKRKRATITVVESCCGGLINSSIMAVPGSSAVYWGGSVAYNTRNAKPFLLNDETLHATLTAPFEGSSNDRSEADRYMESKLDWTAKTAVAFCDAVGTNYAIAEGGASGPTFRPKGLERGFAAIAIAARGDDGKAKLVKQELVKSPNNNRVANMRLFADAAAELALEAIGEEGDAATIEDDDIPTTPHLDRATHLRCDELELEELSKTAQYVVLQDNKALFLPDWKLAKLSLSEVESICQESGATPVTTFLGLLDGQDPVFGVDLNGGVEEDVIAAATKVSHGAEFGDTRTGAPLLSPLDNELVLYATALAQWQRRAPYCAACGSPTVLEDGGTNRECTSCGAKSWPRQDPSMIAVISSRDKDRVLLGRSLRHPPQMYTALAGFVEAGETFEKAVAREVYEETGVRIDEDSVSYIGSQPWPFPQSIMIGFSATADDTQVLYVDKNELVDAAWFDRKQLEAAATVPGAVMRKEVAQAALEKDPSLELLIPPKGVLARTLLDTWLDRRV